MWIANNYVKNDGIVRRAFSLAACQIVQNSIRFESRHYLPKIQLRRRALEMFERRPNNSIALVSNLMKGLR